MRGRTIACALLMFLLSSSFSSLAQRQSSQPQPEFIKKGQQLTREGKPEEALALYRQEFSNATNAVQAQIAA